MLERVAFTSGAAALLSFVAAGAVRAQADLPPADSLTLSPEWDVARFQPRDALVAFALSRPVREEDGRLAVIVGRADLSVLLEVSGSRARLPLRGERLPAGDLEVVAYLVSPAGEWRELGRFALRRLTRGGFESVAVRPKLDLQSDGQLDARLPPGASPGAREGVYQDLTLNGGVDGGLRGGGREAGVQGFMLGATRTAARLRAAQLGRHAPPLDLASYNVRLTGGRLGLAAGHMELGTHRYVINQFRSRGVSAELQVARGVRVGLAGLAGSEIVGWDDPLGVARPAHRVLTASLGIEAAPSRPGLLRLDLTTLDGSLRPIPAFTQQAVTDRERSAGLGAQLTAADPSQRVRLALGVARSRFTNPADPALSGDSALVPVRRETRTARFGEVALDAVRGAKLGRTAASLSIAARHERVDPQYRSVAVAAQADREQDGVDATAALDALQVQAGITRARDNLGRIPSLLTTRTRGQSLTAALPVAQLVRASPAAWWWPALTLGWQVVSQVGDAAPPNGGFRFPFQVPNQRSSSLTLGAGWQRTRWSVAGRYSHSLVDNRQPERERSDFASDAYGVTLGLTSSPRLMLALDLAREAMRDVERDMRTRSGRVSLQGDWRPVGHTAVTGAYSLATTRDEISTRRGQNTELRLEVSQGFNLYARPQDGSQTRVFLRYARAGAALRVAGALQPAVVQWTVNGGLSHRVF